VDHGIWLLTAGLHQAMVSTGYVSLNVAPWLFVIHLHIDPCCGCLWLEDFHPHCSDLMLFPQRSAVVPIGNCAVWSWASTLLEFQFCFSYWCNIRVKCYVNGLLNPMNVPMWVTINKLNLVPQRRLCMWPVTLACSEMAEVWVHDRHMSGSCFLIHSGIVLPVSTFTGNLAAYSILSIWVNSVLRSH